MIVVHNCISGFGQKVGGRRGGHGTFRLAETLIQHGHNSQRQRVLLWRWNEDWRRVAEYHAQISAFHLQDLLIAVYAYSWGAGWGAMRERLRNAIARYRDDPPPLPAEETAEAIAFLDWLLRDNFTFLGMREYEFAGGERKGDLTRRETDGLGILSDPGVRVLRRGGEAVTMTPAAQPSSRIAKASSGVGNVRGMTSALNPAPVMISAVSRAKTSELWRASNPITTDPPRCPVSRR